MPQPRHMQLRLLSANCHVETAILCQGRGCCTVSGLGGTFWSDVEELNSRRNIMRVCMYGKYRQWSPKWQVCGWLWLSSAALGSCCLSSQ
jgi:hypothetical protein